MKHSRIHVIALAVGLAFGTAAAAQSLSAGDYKAGKKEIAADYKSALSDCAPMTGNEKERCRSEAAGKQKVAKAELDERYKASRKSRATAAPVATSKQETPTEYVDDSVITAKVKAAVLGEPTLKSAEINVETYKGKVQLSGFVRSRVDINKAVEVARTVKGVASVDNVMIVKGQQQQR